MPPDVKTYAVFVHSITKAGTYPAVAEASNGSPEGPPFIRFELGSRDVQRCHIGKRYNVILEEAE